MRLVPPAQPPSSNTVTRTSQPGAPPSSQIQLEEHQPSYPRNHLTFPQHQHQRYLPDTQVHPHAHLQRRPFPVPQSITDPGDTTPGPSHTSAEEDADDYPNGTPADADSSISESHDREGRPLIQGDEDAPIDEEPLYVNAKQYNRILKRRVARARLEELHRLSRQRKVGDLSRSTYSHITYSLNSHIYTSPDTSTPCAVPAAQGDDFLQQKKLRPSRRLQNHPILLLSIQIQILPLRSEKL